MHCHKTNVALIGLKRRKRNCISQGQAMAQDEPHDPVGYPKFGIVCVTFTRDSRRRWIIIPLSHRAGLLIAKNISSPQRRDNDSASKFSKAADVYG